MKDAPPTMRAARRSVQSVDRALDLLEALTAAEGEVSITALAARTRLHVSTVHRLLATLLRRGYVRQNTDTSRYYAGAKLAAFSDGRGRFNELRIAARPLLRTLVDVTRETANLSVLDDTAAVYIETAASPQVVRLFTVVGNRVPLHATGAGKALLAALPVPRREAILDQTGLEPHTAKTIVERGALAKALEIARENGYAFDDEEFDEGVRCIAVPVGPVGAPLAALSISGPANRLTRQRCLDFVPQMRRCAQELAEAVREGRGS